jgi:hypothetical protein
MYRSNYTIDDSQWSTPSLTLSPGWNMLNATSSYFISQDQVDQVRPLLDGFHGGSYSWNTHAGCSNTITFVGMSLLLFPWLLTLASTAPQFPSFRSRFDGTKNKADA